MNTPMFSPIIVLPLKAVALPDGGENKKQKRGSGE